VTLSVVGALLVGGSLLLGGCRGDRHASDALSVAPGPAPAIEWGGCARVYKGPVCELDSERKVTLWTPKGGAQGWKFLADVRPVTPRAAGPKDGGWQFQLQLPADTASLVAVEPQRGEAFWRLAVRESVADHEIEDLVRTGKKGDASAIARLRSFATTSGSPQVRLAAEAGYGRVMLARGDMAGAEAALRRAITDDRALGWLSEEMRDGVALAWGLAEQQQRFADAREILRALATVRDAYPEGRAWYAYTEGLLAVETGDLRNALGDYRTAVQFADRLGTQPLADLAAEDVGVILAQLGRFEEAMNALESLPSHADGCTQASSMINRTEVLLSAAMRGEPIPDARLRPVIAAEQEATTLCPDPRRRLFAAVHAARGAIHLGDRRALDDVADRIRAEDSLEDRLTRALRADILGRWSLVRREARRALAWFDEEARIAAGGGVASERFRAEVGAGEALWALGRRRDAIRRFSTAQRLLGEAFQDVPIAEGRGEFLSSHDEAVRHLVDALVDSGDLRRAMAVARVTRVAEIAGAARLNRISVLSAMQRREWESAIARYVSIRRRNEEEAGEEWKLPASALAAARRDREVRGSEASRALDAAYRLLNEASGATPQSPRRIGKGEVAITFFPGVKRWLAFGATSTSLRVHRFSETAFDSNQTAAAVLEALSPELETAERAVFFSFGRSDRVDWHAVRWRGEPLISRMEVEYSMDLPEGPDQTWQPGPSGSALIVANPTGDLPAADAEASLVARVLASWRMTRMERSAATRDAVLQALPGVDLLHYAGHAELAGPSGSLSSIVLTGGARMQLGDLFALPAVPKVVVLSACRAAASGGTDAERGSASVMGLAQAFLAAGSHLVIAPTRELPDVDARRFIAALYEGWSAGGVAALAAAFRRAASGPAASSAVTFRFMVR